MDAKTQRPKRQDNSLSLLSAAIEAMNLAKEVSSATPAKAVFGSVSALLTMIRDSTANKADYVELGLACAGVCKALDRGMNGKKLRDLSPSVREAIEELTRTVAEIRGNITEKGGRNLFSRLVHAKDDKETIAAWKLSLNRFLHVFNTELAVNTHVAVSGIRRDVSKIHRNMSKIREEIGDRTHSVETRISGESPPPPSRACFGRKKLIKRIIGLTENLTPLALTGPGGVGKTSIALTVLHHDRVKQRFGDNRRFIRCDQFPASRTHFLARLSKVIGAGVENPEDLAPLRSFLSSREMILFLDNAESILDPRGPNAREIYAVVEELSQIGNICLCLTSRISTIPPDCKRLDIPTLSMDAACRAFYRVYDSDERSELVNTILQRLDFHPLSITLLATVAHHNRWDANRLAKEWERQRTDVLHTQHNNSLAATIELSLASPMFRNLGPDARGLLGVIAFLPQGVNENSIDWLFPTLPERTTVFDSFCTLSLTYRSNGFITMLAPLRDYFLPKDPTSSPRLRTTKYHYFSRLSVRLIRERPGFREAQWIQFEDVNVEHLLDVFTSINTNSVNAWDACANFMRHLRLHKPRPVILGPKIEGLPDDHPSKPQCLYELSRLFDTVGNYTEYRRLLVHTLKLWRERGDDFQVTQTLMLLSNAHMRLGLYKEAVRRGREVLEIYERLNNRSGQARVWECLARSLQLDNQPDAAEEAALRAIDISDGSDQVVVCQCNRFLGGIYHSRGKTGVAINHYEAALRVASSFGWHNQLSWINGSLAELFFSENRFNDAHVHLERAKSHAINYPNSLGHAMRLQAKFWYKEGRIEEARSEVLRAVDVYEGIGATKGVEECKALLRDIERKTGTPVTSGRSGSKARGSGHHLTRLQSYPSTHK